MRVRAALSVCLASLLIVAIDPSGAWAAHPTGHHRIAGRCGGSGGSGANLELYPELAAHFPGANAIGFDFEIDGGAVALDNVGAFSRVTSKVTFRATGGYNQEILWESATVTVRARGFAPEEPFPNEDAAFYPKQVLVLMRPVGFSAPSVLLSWSTTTYVVWVGGTINCSFNSDIPTLPIVNRDMRPVDDGAAIDADLDGAGDTVLNGLASVPVGFNTSVSPGEHRGVYVFDLSEIRSCRRLFSASLMLSFTGTQGDGSDPNLTLYAQGGDGAVDVGDFGTGSLVTAFSAFDADPFNILDVTGTVRALIKSGGSFATFVVRPDPSAVDIPGAFLYSGNEISDTFGFEPTILRTSCLSP